MDSTESIYVSRWSVTSWDPRFGDTGILNLSTFGLALDGAGNPAVNYFDDTSFAAGVLTWSGSQWTPSPSLSSESGNDLAFTSSGAPMLIAQQQDFVVQQLNGGKWAAAPTTPVPVGAGSLLPNLAATIGGRPVVGWLEIGSGKHGLARWTDKDWDVRFGLFRADQGADSSLDLVVDQKDDVWAAWLEGGKAYVWMSNY
jgi:hypothetical protein